MQCVFWILFYSVITIISIEGYHVTCDYHESDKTMIIENLESKYRIQRLFAKMWSLRGCDRDI